MSQRRGGGCSIGCMLALGLLALAAILGFIFASSMIARAENNFGPPAARLSAIQRAQLGIQFGWRAETLLRPLDAGAPLQAFAIEFGEDTGSILGRLQSSGLIRDAGLFRDYLVWTGLDTQLQAGEFELSPAMNSVELAAALLDPTPGEVALTIFPGWRLEEVMAAVENSGLEFPSADFWTAVEADYPEYGFLSSRPAGARLEGYLLAGTYELPRESSAEELVRVLLDTFESEVGEEMYQGWESQALTVHQALTFASIVSREAILEEEMPLIASVFLNRYSVGAKLGADPTVQYALGYDEASQSWWTRPLLTGHLAVDSPYNTYLYAGLPPGPIASSSLAALEAVAFPAESGFYYFQAACDGSGAHVFAVSYAEHLANNCE